MWFGVGHGQVGRFKLDIEYNFVIFFESHSSIRNWGKINGKFSSHRIRYKIRHDFSFRSISKFSGMWFGPITLGLVMTKLVDSSWSYPSSTLVRRRAIRISLGGMKRC